MDCDLWIQDVNSFMNNKTLLQMEEAKGYHNYGNL